jgi:hypothetical protein
MKQVFKGGNKMKKTLPKHIEDGVAGIESLDAERKEHNIKADQILSTSAMGQAPQCYFDTVEKALQVCQKQAAIWNDIRSFILPGTNKTLWQIASQSKKLAVVFFGQENILDFYGKDLRDVLIGELN